MEILDFFPSIYLSAFYEKEPVFNLNDFSGILYARTAGDLATLLGIVHLLRPAITVIFQGKCLLRHSLNVPVHLAFL
jgi:hypothetical protein